MQQATVIATYSRRVELRFDDRMTVMGRIRGKRLKAVCGDRVLAEPIEGEADWLVTTVLERRNALTRPNRRGRTDVLAANVDALVVVAAVSPRTDWYIVDRYLCAAELMAADPVVVYNKIDLCDPADAAPEPLNEYRQIGLPVTQTSVHEKEGLAALRDWLTGSCAMLVGQSGVGKSSLVNALTDGKKRATAALSAKTGEGRHTTVNSVIIDINYQTQLIDSPGVRDYAPVFQSAREVAYGFREIRELGDSCHFADCLHLREPGCAVLAAVSDNAVSDRRYASYRRAINIAREFAR